MKCSQADLAWLENPEVFQVNRLEPHSDHCFYMTEEKTGEAFETKQSLNGSWLFSWSAKPCERPEDFWRDGYDDSGFGRIEVPGHIELQGYGKIQYINSMYPWEGHAELRPPHIDWNDNPVGSYVKRFDLDRRLLGKRVYISFQGIDSAFYVWLNGNFVGYSEDSCTPSEFDLTPYVREKRNRLCVEVYKRSSASWIEDQDFFRFSGIFRDVYLYAKPEYHVEDLWLQAGLLEDYQTGSFQVTFRLSENSVQGESIHITDIQQKGISLILSLKSPEGTAVWEQKIESLKAGGDGRVFSTETICLPGMHLWSSEDPYLYQFTFQLLRDGGILVETVPYKIGFRRFEIKDKIMLLNGKRLVVNGVNRHEWNPRRGRSVTKEDMKKDIEILKRNHINAVRTSHYPNQSLWYELCDRNGIYLMDETNLESHGSWQKMGKLEPSWTVPGSRPEWEACVVDRAASMFQRDKNHTSILWWSCGNESYAGTCIAAISQYFRSNDPSRLVHYEGVFWNREFDDITDLETRMYSPPEEVRAYLENQPPKPFLMCEYMHDMGNSLGGMESYIRLSEEFPMYQGGFIWDYIDQALYRVDGYGNEVLAYGGDFCDRPTNYAFSANGIVFADRTEKPAMQEVRYWYSTAEERRAFDEQNKRMAEEADQKLKEKTERKNLGCYKPWKIIHGDNSLGIQGENYHFIFSYIKSGPVSLVYDGVEWLYREPRLAFWRAATENDSGNGFPENSAMWIGADQYIRCTGYQVEEEKDWVKITYSFLTCTSPEADAFVSYTITPDGKISVHAQYKGKKGLPPLPLFGLRFVLPENSSKIRWLGLSGETYPDRKKGGVFGIHEGRPEITRYLVPQESSNHMDTRWMQLWRKSKGLEFVMEGVPFHFSAIPYTPQELDSAFHIEDLPLPMRTVVTLLSHMRGVGGINSWGSDVEKPYRISGENDLDLTFSIGRPEK